MIEPFTLWFTGLPCSGKTTLAVATQKMLRDKYGTRSAILDGDAVRAALWPDLGFSPEARRANVLNVAHLARTIMDSGGIAIVALVSPDAMVREEAYDLLGVAHEVFVDAPAAICAARDVKGHWDKAARGLIKGFTGYDAPYDEPIVPHLHLHTDWMTEERCLQEIEDSLPCLPMPGAQLFIGRWSPFHNGHLHIIKDAEGKGPIAIGVRCSEDDYTVMERIEMARAACPDAIVFPVPDIASVNIGRKVGYEVVRYDVPEHIHGISATQIREQIASGDPSWRQTVPREVGAIIDTIHASRKKSPA